MPLPEGALLSGFRCNTCKHVGMIPQEVPEQALCDLQRTALTEFFTAYQIIFAYFDTLRIPRIHRAAVSYFLQMLLHNGRLSAQTLIVTFKATTVDRLNNDWSSKTVSGIQNKQDSTIYQRSLNAANRPHCQLAESATNN